jgi:hypothetical protein
MMPPMPSCIGCQHARWINQSAGRCTFSVPMLPPLPSAFVWLYLQHGPTHAMRANSKAIPSGLEPIKRAEHDGCAYHAEK